MSKHRRVLGYARVSSAEQALGTSLQDQQAAITAYAQARGLTVSRFFVEAESAIHEKIELRDQILALLAEVKEGDLVLCDKLDRWSRDPEFTHGSVKKIKAAGAAFHAVAEHLDASTDEGDFMLGIRAVLAKEEHKRIRIRTVGTRKLLRDRGYYVEGSPPMGYRRAHGRGYKGADKNILVIHEDEAAIVRRAFALCVAGRSINEIGQALRLTRDIVQKMLRRRTYVGEIKDSRGEWIVGKHPLLIDPEMFARAQAALDQRTLGDVRSRAMGCETEGWLLRDIARCGLCEARMAAAYAGTREARRYYYRCVRRCTTRYVPVARAEREASAMVLVRLGDMRDELARGPEPESGRVLVDFAARRTQLDRRRRKILDQYEDDLITRDELRAKIAKVDAELHQLTASEAAARLPGLADAEVRRSALREIGSVELAWSLATPVQRRQIVNRLAVRCALEIEVAPRFVWRPLADLLAGVEG